MRAATLFYVGGLLGSLLTVNAVATNRCEVALLKQIQTSEIPSVRRYHRPLQKLHDLLLAADSPTAAADKIIATDARSKAFFLEGLNRFHSEDFGSDFDALALVVNDLEDVVGDAVDFGRFLKFAREVKVPRRYLEQLEREANEGRDRLAQHLVRRGWFPVRTGRVWNNALAAVLDADWDDVDDERDHVLKKLSKFLKKTQKADFDLDKLEDGVHHLRRQLRWFLIQIRATGGLIRLKDEVGPVEEFAHLMDGDLANGPFGKLPVEVRNQGEPCEISKGLYLGLSWINELVATAKNFGQREHTLALSARRANPALSLAEARKIAKEWTMRHPDYVEWKPAAQQAYLLLKSTKVLKELRKQIDACR